jgi:hypothetical protein
MWSGHKQELWKRSRGHNWQTIQDRKADKEKRAARQATQAASPPSPAPPPRTPPPTSPTTFRNAARVEAPGVLEELVRLVKNAGSESTRVSAANAVLDRAFGKPLSGARLEAEDEDEVADGEVLRLRWLDPKT